MMSKRRKKLQKSWGTGRKGRPRRSLAVWFPRFPWVPGGMFGEREMKGARIPKELGMIWRPYSI